MAFRICSGQGRKHDRWSVCCDDGTFPLWWRPLDARGNTRTFKSADAAARFMATLNEMQVRFDLARNRAAIIKDYASRGRQGWEALHRYPATRAIWAHDPFGLFTADIVEPV